MRINNILLFIRLGLSLLHLRIQVLKYSMIQRIDKFISFYDPLLFK